MDDIKSTAIYFQLPLENNLQPYNKLISHSNSLKNVHKVWKSNDKKINDIDSISAQIIESGISRIIMVGENPGYKKAFFARAMAIAKKQPDDIFIIDFKEYFTSHEAMDVYGVALFNSIVNEDISNNFFDVEGYPGGKDTLVIGAGIAGIQASLEIANSKNNVILVERTGSIGGHMAKFDKTFPTLDCAACILTPKMVEVGQHEYIDLKTNSEVQSVEGRPGKFKVKILQKARYVEVNACTGCGVCADVCPVNVSSEFDEGTTMRKAIYIPFPQAVPNKFLIDAENCRFIQEEKCGVCAKKCAAECIDFNEKDKIVEIEVGNIIVSTGFKAFDAGKINEYGYGKFPNVLTSLEFERLINASGPTLGDITYRKQDKKGNWIFEPGNGTPKKLAIIHCVGSRDDRHNVYCSRVCCMYSLKLAHLIKEKIPKAKVYEYFIDMRAYGKGYEEFYDRIKDEGVHLIRGKTAKIEQVNGSLKLRSEDILNEKIIEQEVDMVILSVALEPTTDNSSLAKMLNIQTSDDGFLKQMMSVYDGESTNVSGITIAGACQGPKDIPDSVAQGSAAASKVLQNILRGTTYSEHKDPNFEYINKYFTELSPKEEL